MLQEMAVKSAEKKKQDRLQVHKHDISYFLKKGKQAAKAQEEQKLAQQQNNAIQQEEQQKLAELPAWKRDMLLRKQRAAEQVFS